MPNGKTMGVPARRFFCLLALVSALVAAMASTAVPAESAPRWGFADNWTARHDGLGGAGLGGIGATMARLDVQWSMLQPSENGPLDQGYLDQLKLTYNIMLYVGVLPIVSVGNAPDWAKVPVPPCPVPGGCYAAPDPTRPGMYDAWQSFVVQLLQQLPHPAAPPAALEVWNEPNYNRFWWPTPQPAVQAELLRRAVLARNAVYPGGAATTPVVSGGLSPVKDSQNVVHPGVYTQICTTASAARTGEPSSTGSAFIRTPSWAIRPRGRRARTSPRRCGTASTTCARSGTRTETRARAFGSLRSACRVSRPPPA
jgi:hypothetical protein